MCAPESSAAKSVPRSSLLPVRHSSACSMATEEASTALSGAAKTGTTSSEHHFTDYNPIM